MSRKALAPSPLFPGAGEGWGDGELGANARTLHVPSFPPHPGVAPGFSHGTTGTTGTNLPLPPPLLPRGEGGKVRSASCDTCHAPSGAARRIASLGRGWLVKAWQVQGATLPVGVSACSRQSWARQSQAYLMSCLTRKGPKLNRVIPSMSWVPKVSWASGAQWMPERVRMP